MEDPAVANTAGPGRRCAGCGGNNTCHEQSGRAVAAPARHAAPYCGGGGLELSPVAGLQPTPSDKGGRIVDDVIT